MKKLFAVTLSLVMLILTASGCEKAKSDEKESKPLQESTSFAENTTQSSKPVQETIYETLVFENEEYKFSVQKSDFEKNYSEELLTKISELIPLQYGVDDYPDWNGTPEKVINDAILCGFDSRSPMYFERYDSESPEWQAALEEIESYEYKVYDNYSITNIAMINSYLADRFGPDARQFKPEDFDTYEEAVTQNGRVADRPDIPGPGYRYIYLPESEVVVCYNAETTGYGGIFTSMYVYDVQTVGNDYVVKAVATDYYDEEQTDAETFDEYQIGTLNLFEHFLPETLADYTMIIGETEEGNIYMKRVTKTLLTSEK